MPTGSRGPGTRKADDVVTRILSDTLDKASKLITDLQGFKKGQKVAYHSVLRFGICLVLFKKVLKVCTCNLILHLHT